MNQLNSINSSSKKFCGAAGNGGANEASRSFDDAPDEIFDVGMVGSSFRLNRDGVFLLDEKIESGEMKVCSPLIVLALTRNGEGGGWGRLLHWLDSDGREHFWSCPMETLAGDGLRFRETLLDRGLVIEPGLKARQALQAYVQTYPTTRRAECVEKLGWHKNMFVLSDDVVGGDRKKIVLQQRGVPVALNMNGSSQDWRTKIGAFCVGNSRLALAVSAAFAAPLVHIVGAESGGVNFVGGSSIGKSTTIFVAASVWSSPDFVKRWRATSNGLESIAMSRNDSLLILDELGQVEAREAGAIAYMLANGTGKHRASQTGNARPAATWRLLFLSTGEIGLADHMQEAGRRAKAGQEVRMVDIEADTGVHGAFEVLHGFANGAEFADYLNKESKQTYGTVIRSYLKEIVKLEEETIKAFVAEISREFEKEYLDESSDGQVKRVARRFALIAAGGELATFFDLTGWHRGEAMRAAGACFGSWIERRGGMGSKENDEVIAIVRFFLEKYGDSRFGPTGKNITVANRAGYFRMTREGKQFLFTREIFRNEVLKGMDYRRACKALHEAGYLVRQGDHYTIKHATLGRLFCIDAKILTDGNE